MTGYKSKKAAAQDKLAHMTFEQRCRVSEQCLPDAPYQKMLTKLHDEMLDALLYPQADYLAQPEQERQWIWLSDADIAEVVDTTCQYTGGYEEYLIKKAERKIRSMNNGT